MSYGRRILPSDAAPATFDGGGSKIASNCVGRGLNGPEDSGSLRKTMMGMLITRDSRMIMSKDNGQISR